MDYRKARVAEELGFLKDAGLFIGVIVLPGIGLALLTSSHPSIGGPISAVVLGARLAKEFEKAHPNWKVTTR